MADNVKAFLIDLLSSIQAGKICSPCIPGSRTAFRNPTKA